MINERKRVSVAQPAVDEDQDQLVVREVLDEIIEKICYGKICCPIDPLTLESLP